MLPASHHRRWRLDGLTGIGAAVLAALGVLAASSGVSGLEEWVFHLVNRLPDAWERPMWAGQLLGLLLVPLALAVLALLLRAWRLALALALLVPTKLLIEYRIIKVFADRERPATSMCGGDLECLNLRGDAPAAGVSMPSGHAVIAMGIFWLVAPYLSRRSQWGALALCALVPIARVYLGAHNPLDVVVGGAAGVAAAALLNLVVSVPRPETPASAASAA